MTAQGEDILAFLGRAIDEREKVARATDGGSWTADDRMYEEWDATVGSSSYHGGAVANCHPEDAQHIALHDPASVLRRCAADRKLMELHGGSAHACPDYYDDGDLDQFVHFYNHETCPVIQSLAEGYGWTEGGR